MGAPTEDGTVYRCGRCGTVLGRSLARVLVFTGGESVNARTDVRCPGCGWWQRWFPDDARARGRNPEPDATA